MKIVSLTKTIRLKRLQHIFPLTFAIVVLLGMSVGCKDKNHGDHDMSPCGLNPGSCKSVLEAKDFFLFKMGSYWVYEEETSHLRDSLYVTDYSNDDSGYNFYVRIKSSLTDYEYRFWPTYYSNINGCNISSPISKKCIYVNRSKGKFQDNLGDTEIFFINYKQGDTLSTVGDMDYCPNSKIVVSEILSSYLLNNQEYTQVVKMFESCPRHEGFQPVNIFYSKNIGIIRKELLDSNQVWNLINYHVIQ